MIPKRLLAPTPSRLLRRLGALSNRERFDLMAISALLPLFWLGLRWLGLERWRKFLLRRPLVVNARMPAMQAQSLGELVNVAARYSPAPATCLSRSLLLEWLLRRRGIAAELRIGVQRRGAGLNAHAWVECAGVPVNDRLDIANDFAPFAQLAPTSSLHFQ